MVSAQSQSPKVLMVTFQYPPMAGSSGVQRPLKFSQQLPALGWQPIVLSAHPRAYEMVRESEEPLAQHVYRAFAFDTARHLSWRGRYPRRLALPDRWVSWALGATLTGLRLIKQHHPRAIWSTYPIASAHLAGYLLHKFSALPWIADFRDPMVEGDYPPNPLTRRGHAWVEQLTVRHAERIVFVAPGMQRLYVERYGEVVKQKSQVITNGYDEETFARIDAKPPTANAKLTLLHSGVIYPEERDPRQFFAALGELKREAKLAAADVAIVLRSSGNQDYLTRLIGENDIADIVRLEPPISHQAALQEMLAADALLILQASNCNNQIPAKLYEYIGAQRPIFGLTDPAGDTAQALREAGIDTIANLHDKLDMKQTLVRWLTDLRAGNTPLPSAAVAQANSRKQKAVELARLLDQTTQSLPIK